MRSLAALCFGLLLYGVMGLGANPASAVELTAAERAELAELRQGDMRKLVVHDAPRDVLGEIFRDGDGNELTMAAFEGKVVVLNFWATWCPPCRAEMPSLDRLEGAMGGEDMIVVALSTDRFGIDRVLAFYDEIDIQHLGLFHDRKGIIAREAGILGLPVTVILDRQGREIARMTGEAGWDSANAKAILTRVIEMTGPRA